MDPDTHEPAKPAALPDEGTIGFQRTSDTSVERVVSVNKACLLVGVTRRTLYNWMAAGWIEYVRTASGSRRIVERTLWRQGKPKATE